MTSIDPGVEAAVVAMSQDGLAVKVIAQQCHIADTTVKRIRHRHGVGRPTDRLTEDEQRTALELLKEGASYKEVARTLGRSHAHLSRRFPGYAWTHQQCGQFTRVANQLRSIA